MKQNFSYLYFTTLVFLFASNLNANDFKSKLSNYLGSDFVSRAEWKSEVTPNIEKMEKESGDYTRATLHHTAGNPGEEVELMQMIEMLHVEKNGFSDIGYHFVIAPSGKIYEARDTNYVGAHTLGENSHNYGIALMGCFDTVGCVEEGKVVTEFNENMQNSAARLLAFLSAHSGFSLDQDHVKGRCDYGSRFPYSPGNQIVEKMPEIIRLAKEERNNL